MAKQNAPKRRRNPIPLQWIDAVRSDPDNCQQYRIAQRRIRCSFSLSETKDVVVALSAAGATELAAYFEAHLTIASRPDSYQYE